MLKAILQGELLPIPEAARRLGVQNSTLRAWLLRRRIGFCKIGRSVRIPASEVERLIEAEYIPPRAE